MSVVFVTESASNQSVSEAVQRYEECLLFMFKQSLPVVQTILDDHGTDLGVRTEGRKFVYYYAKLPQLQYVQKYLSGITRKPTICGPVQV